MSFWIGLAVALSVVNLVLLAALSTVWFRNYRTFRTNLLLGLLLFAGVLAMENLVAISAYMMTDMIYAGGETAKYATIFLRFLQLGAVVFLSLVTFFPSGRIGRSLGFGPSAEQS